MTVSRWYCEQNDDGDWCIWERVVSYLDPEFPYRWIATVSDEAMAHMIVNALNAEAVTA